MNDFVRSPLEFLITAVFDLYVLTVMLRFLLQWRRADFYNPIAQFIVKVTSPPLKPLRRLIPGLWGLDLAALLLALVLETIKWGLIIGMRGGGFDGLALLAVAFIDLVSLTFSIFFYTILIEVVLSWVNPGYNPVAAMVSRINEPLLRPVRNLIPPISGIDLSPLVVMLGLEALRRFIIPLLQNLLLG